MKYLGAIFFTAIFFILMPCLSKAQGMGVTASVNTTKDFYTAYNTTFNHLPGFDVQEPEENNAGNHLMADNTETAMTAISYSPISSSTCTFSGMSINGVSITDATGIPLTGAGRPRIYYRKNVGTWFSAPGTNVSGTATSSVWNFTIIETDMGTLSGGDVVSYYIIVQDITPTPNVVSNPAAGLVATDVNTVTTHPTAPNTYKLKYNLAGTYTVGATGNFATLTAALDAYNNACSLSGATIFQLIDNSYPAEIFPLIINNHADASAANTLTIRPSATAVPVITGSSSSSIINLNGARYISFDGRQAGAGVTKSLTITNTSTSGVTIQFINDAQNDAVKYCIVKGMRSSAFSGTIFFSTAGAGTGNDNNTIDRNDITDAGGQSNIGICSSGTTGKENDNISITNNNISNYFNATAKSAGIYVNSNSSGWTITGNRFFQTVTRLYTAANDHYGIFINGGAGYSISNNIIGYATATGTGTTCMVGNSGALAGFPNSYSITGTSVNIRYFAISGGFALVGTPSAIDGNIISNFAMFTGSTTSTNIGIFTGIYIESGTANIGVNAGNIIGGSTGNNAIYVSTTSAGGVVMGIRATFIGTASVQNNTIGSITSSGSSTSICGSFVGINVSGPANVNISSNLIGNTDADNIRMGFATSGGIPSNIGWLTGNLAGITATYRGIITSTTGNTVSITNNILRGWVTACRATAITGIGTSGVLTGANPSVNINNNFIGTATADWINQTVDNSGLNYAIDVNNTNAITHNIKNNDFRGAYNGTLNGVGGALIRLQGATAANNIATISGNTFSNLNFRFSNLATNYLYFIFTSYTLASTGQLIIDNNNTVGNFTSTGPGEHHMIHCSMGSNAGARLSITNNNISNMTATAGFLSEFYGLYAATGGSSCLLTMTGNTLSNWSTGNGSVTVIDVSAITGTTTCSTNNISNISSLNSIDGLTFSPDGSTGQFNFTNNIISGLVSSGSGGFVTGIGAFLPPVATTAIINVEKNTVSGLSSTNSNGTVSGINLFSGNASAVININSNKFYDLSESSASSCHVYGINNASTLNGTVTYSNNYIGDLRAPASIASDRAVAGIKIFMVGGQAKVYYNTIHLNATGSAAQFSTAAIYTDVTPVVVLRNNIFSNTSAHGSTGKTVAFWRNGISLATYDAASGNNLFYAGTASAQSLLFYDGTNSDQLLPAYQTRVTPKDKLSVSALPAFISTTGASTNFLHINPTGNCSVNAKGNNNGILLAADYDADARSTVSPFITDIGADEFSKKNAWTGANGTNWNDAANWSDGIVPNLVDNNVIISGLTVNQPVVATGETYQVASLIMGSTASLLNKGTLKIAGSVFASPASINNFQSGIAEGSVEMNGNCSTAQPLAGNVFVNNTVKNFTVSNDVLISAVTGEQLSISRALGFGAATGKTLNTGDNIILLSTQLATANVEKITGNFIAGKATVERYINTGLLADGRHLKSWQFLSTPTKGQTIFNAWQEGGTAPAGFGTVITGTGSGFDFTTATPSLKYYDPAAGTGSFVGVTNTGNQVNDQRGYMIFVRGDRTVTTSNAAANQTNLRTKGTLYQPSDAPPVTNVPAGKLSSVGNPYASAVDLNYMKNNGLFVNLDNNVVVWDPLLNGTWNLGAYQTLAAANNYIPTAGGTTYYPAGVPSPYIQSGQAFFVKSSGSAGSVTFTEACKESSNTLVNRPAPLPEDRQFFRAYLFTNSGNIADGNAAVFSHKYRNSVDADDAVKLMNSGENFGIARDGITLSVEARNAPGRTDTIFYRIGNLRKQAYQLRFAPENMRLAGLKAVLIDQYLHTETELGLTDSSIVNIMINTEALSAAADRFFVVFKKRSAATAQPVPGTLVQHARSAKQLAVIENAAVSIYPNPVEHKLIQLHLTGQAPGVYQLQLVNNLGQSIYTGSVYITMANSIQSIRLQPQTAAGNYILTMYAENGTKNILQVVIK